MLIYLNAIVFGIAWTAIAICLHINCRKIFLLKNVEIPQEYRWPRVSIIVPARNEERDLLPALESLAKLDYSNYEIIVVNDRSTDRTLNILNDVGLRYKHIRVIDILKLPAGWLGKSHALVQGYRAADADWLLFTDADVKFERSVLKKAVAYCCHKSADHLTVLPEICSRSTIVNTVNSLFQFIFLLKYRPWACQNYKSNAFAGVGAFNLVRTEVYERIGTHARFSMHPNDDLKLGECIKRAGFRQNVMYGKEVVTYEWYSSINEFIQGLTKNAFSSVRYDPIIIIGNVVGSLLFFILPIPLLVFSQNLILIAIAVYAFLLQVISLSGRKKSQNSWWDALMIPASATILSFILIKSAWQTLLHKGVYWSNSFYKLSELKKSK